MKFYFYSIRQLSNHALLIFKNYNKKNLEKSNIDIFSQIFPIEITKIEKSYTKFQKLINKIFLQDNFDLIVSTWNDCYVLKYFNNRININSQRFSSSRLQEFGILDKKLLKKEIEKDLSCTVNKISLAIDNIYLEVSGISIIPEKYNKFNFIINNSTINYISNKFKPYQINIKKENCQLIIDKKFSDHNEELYELFFYNNTFEKNKLIDSL